MVLILVHEYVAQPSSQKYWEFMPVEGGVMQSLMHLKLHWGIFLVWMKQRIKQPV